MELKDKGAQPVKEKETLQGKLDRFNDTVKQNKEEEKTKYETKITNKEEVR
jgi:hypothetical protein